MNCKQLKNTNRLETPLKHNKAAGMFKTNIPSEVEKVMPNNSVILLIKIATPVNPLVNKLHGFMNTWITLTCRKELNNIISIENRKRIFLCLDKFFTNFFICITNDII